MPLPTPKVPLKDHCSLIHDNTLYTYQSNAFQSLELKEGGRWEELPKGVPTTGSACVQGDVDGDAAFIVVGGSTEEEGYKGLQHYSFDSRRWKIDEPVDPVLANRQGHGAAFLKQSSKLLTYGGSQNGDTIASSETFLLSTNSPYGTEAFSSTAPPVLKPQILQYNNTHALMLGGDPANTQLSTFGPDEGWQQLSVSLQRGLKDSSKMQALVLDGNDGSKLLEIFDMSVNPNRIDTLLLQNATASPSHKRSVSYLSSTHHPAKRRKREITLAGRPAYNATLAPQEPRTGFSIASDPQTGLMVATGGNSQAPLALFNETGNQWIDPEQFFGSQANNQPSPTESSSSPSATFSSAAAPSATVAAASNATNMSMRILGGVLGGVLGAALLLIIILLLLRRHRKKKEKQQEQSKSDYALDRKQEMDFRDIGAEYMKEAGGSLPASTHDRSKSNSSTKPNGRSRAASSLSKRALLHTKGDSGDSGKSFWSRGTKSPEKSPPQISAPIMGPSLTRSIASPEPRGPETGWSRYFTEGHSKEMLYQGQNPEDTRPGTYLSQSDYTSSRALSSNPHESAEVEPLNFRPSLLNVPDNGRSPSPSNGRSYPPPGLGVALTHGAPRPIPADSPTPSVVSDILEEEDEYRHSAGQESWSPVESGGERTSNYSGNERPISGYTNSFAHPPPGERMRIPNFPMPSARNSTTASSPISPQAEHAKGLRNVVSRDLIRSNSQRQRATDVVRTGTQRVTPSTAPTVQHFPRPAEHRRPGFRGESDSEDMSWLNLGTSAEQNSNRYFPGR